MKKLPALILAFLLTLTPVTAFAVSEEINTENAFSFDVFDRWEVKSEDIHPELRLLGNAIRIVFPNFTRFFFNLANSFLNMFTLPDLAKGVEKEEVYIEREDGSLLRLCVYTPKEKKDNVPGLLWIHGGGYGLGAPEQDFTFIEDFINASGCVIVAPDYLNSPDAPYPAAFNDCYDALLWLKENVSTYKIRNDKIFVGGNSAGGGLCAAVTLKARDTGDVNIAFQMPLYPMIDDRMETASAQNNDAPVWNTKSNEIAWNMYLGELYGTDDVPKYAAPARETDYSGLPPTLTYVGTIEPFTDETLIYVDNLKNAGVEVMFRSFEGCFHGFILFSFTTPAKEAKQFLIEGFMYAVENYIAQN